MEAYQKAVSDQKLIVSFGALDDNLSAYGDKNRLVVSRCGNYGPCRRGEQF